MTAAIAHLLLLGLWGGVVAAEVVLELSARRASLGGSEVRTLNCRAG